MASNFYRMFMKITDMLEYDKILSFRSFDDEIQAINAKNGTSPKLNKKIIENYIIYLETSLKCTSDSYLTTHNFATSYRMYKYSKIRFSDVVVQ